MPAAGHETPRRFVAAVLCLATIAGLGGCQAAGGPRVGVAGATAAGAVAGGLIGAAAGAAIVPGMVLGAGVGAGAALFARACPQLSQMTAAARWMAPRKWTARLS